MRAVVWCWSPSSPPKKMTSDDETIACMEAALKKRWRLTRLLRWSGGRPKNVRSPRRRQRRNCYEIDKHIDIHSFTPRTLHISHKSHSQIETSKTLNNSHLSIQIINDPINSSYYNHITPIPTLNDTNKLLGDCIYATPTAYTPSKLHICYRGLYIYFFILSFHFHFTIIDAIV